MRMKKRKQKHLVLITAVDVDFHCLFEIFGRLSLIPFLHSTFYSILGLIMLKNIINYAIATFILKSFLSKNKNLCRRHCMHNNGKLIFFLVDIKRLRMVFLYPSILFSSISLESFNVDDAEIILRSLFFSLTHSLQI